MKTLDDLVKLRAKDSKWNMRQAEKRLEEESNNPSCRWFGVLEDDVLDS